MHLAYYCTRHLDCPLRYFGITSRSLRKRISEHRDYISKMDPSSALVRHIQSNPGHSFNLEKASLIWKTHCKKEARLVESSCLRTLPSCNVSPGEIFVGPMVASVVMKATKIQQSNRAASKNSTTDSLYSPTPLNTTNHSTQHSIPTPTPHIPISQPPSTPPYTFQPFSPPSPPPAWSSQPSITNLVPQPLRKPLLRRIASTVPTNSDAMPSPRRLRYHPSQTDRFAGT